MALEASYDRNPHLTSLNNTSFMQFETFDNSLVQLDQYKNFPLLNTSSSINSANTSSRVANFNIDPVPLYTNPFTGLKALTNPSVTDSDPNLNFVEQTPIFASNQSIPLDPNESQVARKKQQQKGSTMNRQNSLPSEIIHDPVNLPQMVNLPHRLDANGEGILGQSISQLSPNTMRSQSNAQKHQIPGLIQQYMRQDWNQLEASSSGAPMCDVLVQPQNQPMCDQPDAGDCGSRVMQYLYHLRLRPGDNNISYWRTFVEEYFAPGAKKRWCVSLHDKAVPVKTVNPKHVWQCDVCGSRAGKGFEVGFNSLPRLTKLVYDNGLTEELLFIDMPESYMLPSGLRVLKYERAVQETVYENFRVVHEGQLCISFTPDLKIMSWEFCAKRHEHFVNPSVFMSQIIQAEQEYQNEINNYRSNGAMLRDSHANRNRVQSVVSRIDDAMNFKLVDGFGFSKTYGCCLKVNETLESMKDLMTFSVAHHMGPIESSKLFYPELQNRKIQKKHTTPTSHFVNTTTNNDFSNTVNERFITPSEVSNSAMLSYNNNNNNYNMMNQAYQVPINQTSTNFAENAMLGSQGHYREPISVQQILLDMMMDPRYSRYRTEMNNEGSQRLFTRTPPGPGNLMQGGSSYSWAGGEPLSKNGHV